MNRQWAQASSLLGMFIAAAGLSLAVWNAVSLPGFYPADRAAIQALESALQYAYWGLVVFAVAGLSLRLLSDDTASEARSPGVVQIVRVGGVLIIVVGTLLAGWKGVKNTPQGGDIWRNSATRRFVADVLEYCMNGIILVLLAELAGRMPASSGLENDTTEAIEAPELTA